MSRSITELHWGVIGALYIAGMDVGRILSLPDYKHIPRTALEKRVVEGEWKRQREECRKKFKAAQLDDIQTQLKTTTGNYYKFMLAELEMEMEIHRRRPKTPDIMQQVNRLDILQRLNTIGTKVLGLEGIQLPDESKKAYEGLISIQIQASRSASNNPSAPILLDSNKNAYNSVQSSGNAIQEAEFAVIEDITREGNREIAEKEPEDMIGENITDEEAEKIQQELLEKASREKKERKAQRAARRGKAFVRFK